MTEKKDRTTSMDVDALLTEVTGSIQTGKLPKARPAETQKLETAQTQRVPAPEPAPAPQPKKTIRIRQIRSAICAPVDQKQAMAGLGLRRIRHVVERTDTPSLRGQILKVRHLVEVVSE